MTKSGGDNIMKKMTLMDSLLMTKMLQCLRGKMVMIVGEISLPIVPPQRGQWHRLSGWCGSIGKVFEISKAGFLSIPNVIVFLSVIMLVSRQPKYLSHIFVISILLLYLLPILSHFHPGIQAHQPPGHQDLPELYRYSRGMFSFTSSLVNFESKVRFLLRLLRFRSRLAA